MTFYSLTDHSLRASLHDAAMYAQAPDGGLFLPLSIPRIPDALYRHLSEFSLHDIAYIITNQMLGDDIDSAILQSIVNDTLCFDIPVVQVDSNVWSLELFHGPSGSFKDVGVRFLARLLRYYNSLRGNDETINLLVATAGPAVETIVKAFSDMADIRVFILYPSSRKNRIGFFNIGCQATNIVPVEVDGTFDDCQTIIKKALADESLRSSIALSSANSLNIARLLPQTFYYFWAYAQLQRNGVECDTLRFSVPSGNFGNLCAGVMSKIMGLPVSKFVAAENSNCPFNRFMTDGDRSDITATPTLAGALDVGSPANLPRLLRLYGDSVENLKKDITGATVDDDTIRSTIMDIYYGYNYLLDPHSAVACRALYDNLQPGETGVFLSTAAPGKSRDILTQLLGDIPLASISQPAAQSDIRPARINAGYPALKKFLLTYEGLARPLH